MNEASQTTIGDFFKLVPGFAFKSSDFTDNGVRVIKIKNVKAGYFSDHEFAYVAPTFLTARPEKLARIGDLLISMSGNRHDGSPETWVGKVAFFNRYEPHFINQRVGALRPKQQAMIDVRFASFLLASRPYQELFISIATSSGGQANLSPNQILSAPLTPPSLDQQLGIAALLGALDDKIELNRRVNETLEAMARAIFQDWFVTFGPTRAKMEGRPPYLAPDLWSLFPDRLDAEGKPEDWKWGILNDVVSILETGGRPKGGVSAYREGVPSIGAESIVGLGIFDYNKTKFIPRSYFEKMTKGHIQSRDVLLYKDGGRPGEFEPHATLFGDGFPFEECAINEHVYRIRATPDFGQNLLYFSLTSDATMAEMRLKGTGVAIPGLNSTQARSLTLLLPSRTAAEGFERTTEPFIGRVLANCKEAKTLAATRDLLLPRLMSGELRVKEAEHIIEAAV